jgi:poly(A) polymerase
MNPAPQSWPESLYRNACLIVSRLRDHGYEAYFAGGCIRDMLLQRISPDIDIASSARPEEVLQLFAQVIPVGIKYGVVAVRQDGQIFEVTTFRRDLDYRDGRHPAGVEFADVREDALRRDFTINGLFFDPLQERVLDFVDGQEDIRKRTIRAIGRPEERFLEDHLRMLRAVRFASTLHFDIEPRTMDAIRGGAPAIRQISGERVRDELLKMFTCPFPATALDYLDRSRLLAVLLPEVQAMHGVMQPPEFHPEGDVFRHTRKMLEFLQCPTKTMVLGVLLHDEIGRASCRERVYVQV